MDISKLLGIDEAIKRMETLQTKAATAIPKGFSNQRELQNVMQSYTDILSLARQTRQEMNNMANIHFETNLNDLKNQIDQANSAIGTLSGLIRNDVRTALNQLGDKKNLAETFVNGAKAGKNYLSIVKEISKALDNQLQDTENGAKAIAAQLDKTRKSFTSLIETTTAKTAFNPNSVNRESFLNQNDFGGKVSGTIASADEYKQIQNIYNQLLSNASGKTTGKSLLKTFKSELTSLGITMKDENKVLQTFKKSLDSLQNTNAGSTFRVLRDQINKLTRNEEQANNALQRYATNIKTFKSQILSDTELRANFESVAHEMNRAATLQNKAIANNASRPEFFGQSKELSSYLKKMDKAKNQMQSVNESALKTMQRVNGIFGRITDGFDRYFSGWYIIRETMQTIRKTFNDIEKLDKAFASIAMVTDKSVQQLWNSYGEYQQIANKLGQSTESAIRASALYYQQGMGTADALKLTEDTMKLATLAGADFETATQQLTAALRGFRMEMSEGAHVTDVYSELAAHAAADVNGIAYAMSKTASIAESAGMSFENTAAFLTNMINFQSFIIVILYRTTNMRESPQSFYY